MKTHFSDQIELYDGSQLASLFTYQRYGILGDSIVSWIGPCDVTQHMVDVEDQRAGELIRGGLMLHFIIEVFEQSLAVGVSVQRIFASLLMEYVRSDLRVNGAEIRRAGDDLFVKKSNSTGEGKWSISIATQSPVSTLVHFAVNVTNANTPVQTWAIEDETGSAKALGRARDLASAMMERFVTEYESICDATRKVHPVGSYQVGV